VAIKGTNQTRPLVWEDDAPMEPRFRRAQKSVPFSNRNLPGMPVAMDDPDSDEGTSSRRRRDEQPRQPWWKPSGTFGRALLGISTLLVVVGAAIGLHRTRQFFLHDSQFRIAGASNIQATGLNQVNRANLLSIFGADLGRNIFFVPLAERRAQLEQIPWVQSATVMRILPNQIHLSIVERTPVAFARQGQQIGLVDADGVLLEMSPAGMAQHHYSFPVLIGIDERDPLASRKVRMSLYLRLMSDLDSSGQHNSNQISEIDLTDPEDARVLMPGPGSDVMVHFGEDHFLERYQRYKAHIAEWRQQYPKLAEVDLRYDQQVVLQMTPGAVGDSTATPKLPASESTSPPSSATPHLAANSLKTAAPARSVPVTTASSNTQAAAPKASKRPVAARLVKTAGVRHLPAKKLPSANAKPAKRRPSQQMIERAAARQRAARARARQRAASRHTAHHQSKSGIPKTKSTQTAAQGM
jgi:cell division protein FtsQ